MGIWLIACVALSLVGSLMLGRKARAWVDEKAPVRMPVRVEPDRELGVARLDVVHVPRLPFEPDEPAAPDAASELPFVPDPSLSRAELALYDVNAKQSLRVRPFAADGSPNDASFASLSAFLRCRRTGQTRDMNPKLVALLTRIAKRFGSPVVEIISAHRVADGSVTRDSSQHVRGTAADIRIAGVSVETLAKEAQEAGARGVGIYPAHRFVHVDVRSKAYSWRGEERKLVERATEPVTPESEAPAL